MKRVVTRALSLAVGGVLLVSVFRLGNSTGLYVALGPILLALYLTLFADGWTWEYGSGGVELSTRNLPRTIREDPISIGVMVGWIIYATIGVILYLVNQMSK